MRGHVRYRLKVFLVLTSILVVASIGWSLWRDRTHADEREAWEAVTDTLRAQKARIDSLEAALNALDDRVEDGKHRMEGMKERMGHYERRAVGGRLPTPQYREYMRTIDDHNRVVARHNRDLAEMHRIYAEYSDLIDAHNALVDSANAMQRRATQEGYALPEVGLDELRRAPRR